MFAGACNGVFAIPGQRQDPGAAVAFAAGLFQHAEANEAAHHGRDGTVIEAQVAREARLVQLLHRRHARQHTKLRCRDPGHFDQLPVCDLAQLLGCDLEPGIKPWIFVSRRHALPLRHAIAADILH